jgi:hypothetical protein
VSNKVYPLQKSDTFAPYNKKKELLNCNGSSQTIEFPATLLGPDLSKTYTEHLYLEIKMFSAEVTSGAFVDKLKSLVGKSPTFAKTCTIETNVYYSKPYSLKSTTLDLPEYTKSTQITNISDISTFITKLLEKFPIRTKESKGDNKDTENSAIEEVSKQPGAAIAPDSTAPPKGWAVDAITPKATTKSRAALWARLHELACEAEKLTIAY